MEGSVKCKEKGAMGFQPYKKFKWKEIKFDGQGLINAARSLFNP